MPEEETLKEQEAKVDKEMTSLMNVSFSSPNEAIMPPPPSTADRPFHELMKRVAGTLRIPLEPWFSTRDLWGAASWFQRSTLDLLELKGENQS